MCTLQPDTKTLCLGVLGIRLIGASKLQDVMHVLEPCFKQLFEGAAKLLPTGVRACVPYHLTVEVDAASPGTSKAVSTSKVLR
jgi:hypothetical protein